MGDPEVRNTTWSARATDICGARAVEPLEDERDD